MFEKRVLDKQRLGRKPESNKPISRAERIRKWLKIGLATGLIGTATLAGVRHLSHESENNRGRDASAIVEHIQREHIDNNELRERELRHNESRFIDNQYVTYSLDMMVENYRILTQNDHTPINLRLYNKLTDINNIWKIYLEVSKRFYTNNNTDYREQDSIFEYHIYRILYDPTSIRLSGVAKLKLLENIYNTIRSMRVEEFRYMDSETELNTQYNHIHGGLKRVNLRQYYLLQIIEMEDFRQDRNLDWVLQYQHPSQMEVILEWFRTYNFNFDKQKEFIASAINGGLDKNDILSLVETNPQMVEYLSNLIIECNEDVRQHIDVGITKEDLAIIKLLDNHISWFHNEVKALLTYRFAWFFSDLDEYTMYWKRLNLMKMTADYVYARRIEANDSLFNRLRFALDRVKHDTTDSELSDIFRQYIL